MINISIGNKKYKVKEAKTEEEKIKGLQNIDKLPEDEGMLFYFDNEEVSFYMKNTYIPLDIIFINDDYEVISVKEGVPESEKLLTENNVAYVLEVNQNSGIKKGDELDFEDTPIMKILAPDGSTQMELYGGERIFRRAFTKQLIKLIKQADLIKNESEQYDQICKKIGKKMFKEIKVQDNRPAEYVSAPS